ncbi:MAG: MgtC/SapB family protein [Candidatus Yanofskybacteria bacterium]|nr:MgtC/SapB family protein [Candidatus Yanofskybacteria bacterium]
MNTLRSLVTLADLNILIRLVAATVLGGVIGYERERSGKIAGLRTHTLVALGSALFTAISFLLYRELPSINGVIGYDYHLIANIIVGIGFIGAGAIMRNGDRVSGTTTAASLWVVAAIGMASGLGFFKEAAATTILAYLVLTALWALEQRMRKSVHYQHDHPAEAASAAADEKSAAS